MCVSKIYYFHQSVNANTDIEIVEVQNNGLQRFHNRHLPY